VELESAYSAATVGLSADIKQGNDRLTILAQEYHTKKIKNYLKKSQSSKAKYMTQKNAAQNIKKSTSVQH
jgi:hypothetical protein